MVNNAEALSPIMAMVRRPFLQAERRTNASLGKSSSQIGDRAQDEREGG
jgi:hypothetical protein